MDSQHSSCAAAGHGASVAGHFASTAVPYHWQPLAMHRPWLALPRRWNHRRPDLLCPLFPNKGEAKGPRVRITNNPGFQMQSQDSYE